MQLIVIIFSIRILDILISIPGADIMIAIIIITNLERYELWDSVGSSLENVFYQTNCMNYLSI